MALLPHIGLYSGLVPLWLQNDGDKARCHIQNWQFTDTEKGAAPLCLCLRVRKLSQKFLCRYSFIHYWPVSSHAQIESTHWWGRPLWLTQTWSARAGCKVCKEMNLLFPLAWYPSPSGGRPQGIAACVGTWIVGGWEVSSVHSWNRPWRHQLGVGMTTSLLILKFLRVHAWPVPGPRFPLWAEGDSGVWTYLHWSWNGRK